MLLHGNRGFFDNCILRLKLNSGLVRRSNLDGLTNYNAIAVQLFAIADKYEDRSIDLLKGAFEAFPKANWAILTVPRQVKHFGLLDYFQRVTPRSSFTTTEVYIVHRAVIHEIASVRLAAETDFEAIESLSPEFYKNMKMSLIEGQALNPTPSISSPTLLSSSYLMFAGEHAVGGVIIAAEDKIDSLRANFEIEDFVNLDVIERRENHKVLYYFVAPGFHSLGKFLLSEAMRLSGAMCLYQPVVGRDYPNNIQKNN
ncbi:unnamed protein product [Oikopleura dioica]|uniref:Cilia- and flagella-associated protein 61 N-terminal domain-containing protein n=1 Tax=Oikopleura dioica TaxID=34765 RepID=E4Y713_OIKDI|nr:unnamed protein product [Oikopleura dioica]